MRRTEWHRRPVRCDLKKLYGRWTEHSISQEEAAQILGISSRTFRRYTGRYDEDGLEGLLDRRLESSHMFLAGVDQLKINWGTKG